MIWKYQLLCKHHFETFIPCLKFCYIILDDKKFVTLNAILKHVLEKVIDSSVKTCWKNFLLLGLAILMWATRKSKETFSDAIALNRFLISYHFSSIWANQTTTKIILNVFWIMINFLSMEGVRLGNFREKNEKLGPKQIKSWLNWALISNQKTISKDFYGFS